MTTAALITLGMFLIAAAAIATTPQLLQRHTTSNDQFIRWLRARTLIGLGGLAGGITAMIVAIALN